VSKHSVVQEQDTSDDDDSEQGGDDGCEEEEDEVEEEEEEEENTKAYGKKEDELDDNGKGATEKEKDDNNNNNNKENNSNAKIPPPAAQTDGTVGRENDGHNSGHNTTIGNPNTHNNTNRAHRQETDTPVTAGAQSRTSTIASGQRTPGNNTLVQLTGGPFECGRHSTYSGIVNSTNDAVPEEWKGSYQRVAQSYVWPQIKFFTCPSMLDHGSLTWQIVMYHLDGARTELDRKLFWNNRNAREWVEKAILTKRNNVNGCICRQYKGKSGWWAGGVMMLSCFFFACCRQDGVLIPVCPTMNRSIRHGARCPQGTGEAGRDPLPKSGGTPTAGRAIPAGETEDGKGVSQGPEVRYAPV